MFCCFQFYLEKTVLQDVFALKYYRNIVIGETLEPSRVIPGVLHEQWTAAAEEAAVIAIFLVIAQST